MIKVVIENGQHILYCNSERLNHLTKTVVIQDEQHFGTNRCSVEASIFCFGDIVAPAPSCQYNAGRLYTPNGMEISPAYTDANDKDIPILVHIKIEDAQLGEI